MLKGLRRGLDNVARLIATVFISNFCSSRQPTSHPTHGAQPSSCFHPQDLQKDMEAFTSMDKTSDKSEQEAEMLMSLLEKMQPVSIYHDLYRMKLTYLVL